MLTFPVPDVIQGDALADELAAAGLATDLYVTGDDLVLVDLDDSDRSAAQTVVDGHVPPPSGPDRDDLLTEARTKAESLPNGAAKDALLALIGAVG